jgi:PTH2 family peptidyl-tRNA hydrolase
MSDAPQPTAHIASNESSAAPGSATCAETAIAQPSVPAVAPTADGENVSGIVAGSVKMYFLVDTSLRMGGGKVAGQVGHAAALWTRRLERQPTAAYRSWLANHEPKIVLKSDGETMRALLVRHPSQAAAVFDLGRTQIAPNSLTVLAFAPDVPSALPPEITKLKLL